ncbi:HlyD family secretion protein [Inquilinus limosus]|uniref:HlyD family secretion protein n=1 Tax=Inquilinus limosus TaxID=171674 RepID=UPI003F17B352
MATGHPPVPLFRNAFGTAIESDVGVPLGVTAWWSRLYGACLAALIVAAAAAVGFGAYARKAQVSGFLVPDKGLIKVLSTHAGQILEQHVVEGQHVEKDDVLFMIDVSDVSTAGRTADLVVRTLHDRRRMMEQEIQRLATVQASDAEVLAANIASLRQQIAGLQAQIAAQQDYLRLTRQIYEREKNLEDRRVESPAQRDKAEEDVASARAQIASLQYSLATIEGNLAQLEAQQRGLPDKQANDRSAIEQSISELDQEIVQNEEQRLLVVRAPQSGTVTRLTATPGAAVDTATPLLTIVPDGARLDAYLYVPSSAAGFVKPGQDVLLRYDAYPYEKFGMQPATVATVSRTAVAASELPFPVTSDEPLYLVTATLAKSTITTYGREEALQPGAKMQADLVLESRPIWQWAVEPLIAARASL